MLKSGGSGLLDYSASAKTASAAINAQNFTSDVPVSVQFDSVF